MASPRHVRILGSRGDWTADVEGDRLAVIHSTWRDGDRYFDPMHGAKRIGAKYTKYTKYVEALTAHDRVVMQRDTEGGSFGRDGYIGVFRFVDLIVGGDGSTSLRLTGRLPMRPSN